MPPHGNVPPIVHMIPPVVAEAIDRGLRRLRDETDPTERRILAKRISDASEPSSTQSVWAVERLMRMGKR
jgi:hypothetical protein